MWESKDNCIDVNYNTEHVWFEGINGQHIQKPADIRKWEESKCHKLIEKHFPRVKADKMLADLSSIALEWAKNYVRQRQTFKLNTKGENMAPLAFQHDPDGTYHDLAVQLRNVDVSLAHEDDGPSFEPMEDGEELKETSAESKTPYLPVKRSHLLLPRALASRVRHASGCHHLREKGRRCSENKRNFFLSGSTTLIISLRRPADMLSSCIFNSTTLNSPM